MRPCLVTGHWFGPFQFFCRAINRGLARDTENIRFIIITAFRFFAFCRLLLNLWHQKKKNNSMCIEKRFRIYSITFTVAIRRQSVGIRHFSLATFGSKVHVWCVKLCTIRFASAVAISIRAILSESFACFRCGSAFCEELAENVRAWTRCT